MEDNLAFLLHEFEVKDEELANTAAAAAHASVLVAGDLFAHAAHSADFAVYIYVGVDEWYWRRTGRRHECRAHDMRVSTSSADFE